jgi:hypothetical protein
MCLWCETPCLGCQCNRGDLFGASTPTAKVEGPGCPVQQALTPIALLLAARPREKGKCDWSIRVSEYSPPLSLPPSLPDILTRPEDTQRNKFESTKYKRPSDTPRKNLRRFGTAATPTTAIPGREPERARDEEDGTGETEKGKEEEEEEEEAESRREAASPKK